MSLQILQGNEPDSRIFLEEDASLITGQYCGVEMKNGNITGYIRATGCIEKNGESWDISVISVEMLPCGVPYHPLKNVIVYNDTPVSLGRSRIQDLCGTTPLNGQNPLLPLINGDKFDVMDTQGYKRLPYSVVQQLKTERDKATSPSR